jgi:hypothetical protein
MMHLAAHVIAPALGLGGTLHCGLDVLSGRSEPLRQTLPQATRRLRSSAALIEWPETRFPTGARFLCMLAVPLDAGKVANSPRAKLTMRCANGVNKPLSCSPTAHFTEGYDIRTIVISTSNQNR